MPPFRHKELQVILQNDKRGILTVEDAALQLLQLSSDGRPPSRLLTSPLKQFLNGQLAPAPSGSKRRLDLHSLGGGTGTALKLVELHVLVEPNHIKEAEEWLEDLVAAAYSTVKPFRKVLLLVNPAGGKGKSRAIVREIVLPILKAAGTIVDLKETTHRSHAEEIAATMDLNYDVIATASGDGLVYEVLNGLASRPDARRALQIPIAPIPTAGSANAVSTNLFGVKDTFNIPLACLNIVKGEQIPIDLCSVLLLPSRTRRFSFLAQAIGLMVDLDIGTESLRWLGDTRFLVGFLKGVVTNKGAKCRLKMKVVEDDKLKMARKAKERVKERKGAEVLGGGQDPLSDGLTKISLNGSASAEPNGHAHPDAHSNGNGVQVESKPIDDGPIPESLPLEPDDSWITIENATGQNKYSQASAQSLRSQPEAQKKGGWVDGQGILYFYAGMMPWVARDLNQWPVAISGDGLIDVVVQSQVPRLQMTNAISGAEHGDPYWLDTQHYYKASALIAENLDKVNQPIFTIDGESYEFDAFHVEVHPRVANLLSLEGDFSTSDFLKKNYEKT
ncbi:D-erythro-sphingosine kinase [Cryptococcus wingfieldii CBS 7118]|uniref:D-erythro-sphingosine kinase n=1 Tax=Cryptococcus wingfieldii CBS 7118 TaxID=1295528 RepID=A0A1E3JWZ4_9TREE|nr:D-erythro-sphingosine kinase [Cryptococcus wingfieldii CBS 7118]ODO05276.1 D-erythro-sphingosine kinase [Cryptococcus wingfieldii CBS 7118]